MEVKQSWKGPTIYTNNKVSDELVQSVKDACIEHAYVHVSFDVIGRTKHMNLSHELAKELGETYEVEIEYWSYLCKVYRKEVQ